MMRASVAIAAWNASWCIERALDGVLAQTLPAHEIVVADDGSTDGTADRVEERYDGRVRVLRLPHANASVARRAAIAAATGDWIAFLDADDVWHPRKLELQEAFRARHPEVRWISTDGRLVAAEGVVRESWLSDYFDPVTERVGDLSRPLIRRCFTLLSSMVVERRAYDAVGGLDPGLAYAYDYDLWLRLAAHAPGGVMAERLVDYFTGPATLSRRYEPRYREDLEVMRRARAGAYGDAPGLRRIAADRAAELEFKLGLLALRDARYGDARQWLRKSGRRGPWRRRALAVVGSSLPDPALARLTRADWAKELLREATPLGPRLVEEGA